ncbi:centrosome-associated protein 350 [Chanos chanos]|uniref:Centrosome-associated protein 350 n=1 Tax=Chanos chanos TaxID=29144 RepID=A0A6J2W6L8_CHACN|nr:centrosome-associated protein 350 [Chanos chanos]
MWTHTRSEAPVHASSMPAGLDNRRELSSALKNLPQTKTALRHIENHLEAVPSSGVMLASVADSRKTSGTGTRKVSRRDGQHSEDPSVAASKSRGRAGHSPDKSSRSPLRSTTLDNNVRKDSGVEFKDPLSSYREPTTPPSAAYLEALGLLPETSCSALQDPAPSQMVYQRDTRNQQTFDLDSTRSSAFESTAVRYLNDQHALDLAAARGVARAGGPGRERPEPRAAESSLLNEISQASSSPGSASHRLENLRRRQPDDKLEKLKERIRRQREHLEESAERDRLLGYLEQPVGIGGAAGVNVTVPAAKVRKVTTAPPPPIYKGFSTSETKIRTPDGKVWGEEAFHNLSREIYRDLTRQLTESTKPKQKAPEKVKEKKPSKPVRKIHRSASVPDPDTKTAISTSSWRDGQRLVKMILGPAPRLPRESQTDSTARATRTGPMSRSSSDPRPQLNQRSRPSSTQRSRQRGRSEEHGRGSEMSQSGSARPVGAEREKTSNADLLSADIRGILDDLQLDSKEEEPRRESRQRRPASASHARASARVSRSASPGKGAAEAPEPAPKRRHYDADTVRQYMARQQEERKRRLAEERRAQREETERKNKRLQELYKRQREGVAKAHAVPDSPAHKRLQETYTKLLLEQAQLGEELPCAPAPTIVSQQLRPLYQPSGESDKENKRQDRPQSASSSSDLSLHEHQPQPLSRNDLGIAGSSWMQPDWCNPAVVRNSGPLAPPSGQLFTRLLNLDSEPTVPDRDGTHARSHPAAFGGPAADSSRSKMSRIEALRATATSLSSRIESEARKLAGAGVNYGCAHDMGTGLPTQPQEEHRWAKLASPPVKEGSSDPDDLALKIRQLLSAGHTTYDGVLPGAGNLHSFRDQRERGTDAGDLQSTAARSPPTFRNQSERHLRTPPHNTFKNNHLDSSGGSISEGPLLSEGSPSEGAGSPRDSLERVPKAAQHFGATDFCAAQHNGFDQISRFQREAEKYSAYNAGPMTRESKGPWEELAKGSPHSVINIFTKNLNSYNKVMEERGERGSPAVCSNLSVANSLDGAAYEDDFISSHGSGDVSHSSAKRTPNGLSDHIVNSPAEEALRGRSAYEPRASDLLPQRSSGSTPVSSPRSDSSVSKRASEKVVERPLVEGLRSVSSLASDLMSNGSRRGGSERGSARSSVRGTDTDSTLGGASVPSIHSLGSESKRSPRSPVGTPSASPIGSASPRVSPGSGSPPGAVSKGSGSPHATQPRSSSSSSSTVRGKTFAPPSGAEPHPPASGELQFNPAALHQRFSAEFSYLDAVEESVRQLSDAERVRGVCLAQQESVSLAQILKAQQQRHERDLYMLKMKAEQEALETKRQLEETRQRAARAHAELQESMVQAQHAALGGLHETASKMISQQAEAARNTADAARHIREMTELARSQIAGALTVPAPPATNALYENQGQEQHGFVKQLHSHTDTDSSKSAASPGRTRSDGPATPLDSLSGSIPSRRPTISGGGSSNSASAGSSDHRDRSTGSRKAAVSCSVEEEVHTAADESIRTDSAPSLVDEKGDSTSVASEYSLKFDESMTEDEIEEQSFRSLLPSEAHRRGTMEKRHSPRGEPDDDRGRERPSPHDHSKDGSMAFSSGQDSFSKFTMEMVRQYMKEEEVRAQHQSSLLRLRQRALKEKTKAELAWLEHQKRRLRDKGEDDKMPPIRKKQRGLILKLQQEQAEIKRLQEANRAARKERQLLLKQQEEIERMRSTTLKIKERLKCAGEANQESSVSDALEETAAPSVIVTDAETRSPSPVSVSGSETSSIMQKLKKMRSHMDEKHCSPVHYFFSVFTAHHWASLSVCLPNLHPKFQLFIYNQLVRFLTKREQQLMQRRRHAEELLEWRHRLDAEEVEVRRMEKQALAAWEKDEAHSTQQRRDSPSASTSPKANGSPGGPTDREVGSEDDYSPAPSVSSVHTELSAQEQLASPSTDRPVSEVLSTHKTSSPPSDTAYSQEFESSSENKRSPSGKASLSTSRHPDSSRAGTSAGSKSQLRSVSRTTDPRVTDAPSSAPSESTSDQSDIESRIRALKEELRKRKLVACQLKKEQKRRHKERLKAQEASLLKQLESYNDFIQKTTAELNKEPDSTPAAKPQIKAPTSATEKPRIKPPPLQRPETSKNWKIVTESDKSEKVLTDSPIDKDDPTASEHSKYTSVHEDISSDEDPPTVTPTPVLGSPEHMTGLKSLLSPEPLPSHFSEHGFGQEEPAKPQVTDSGDESIISSHRSEVVEELEFVKSEGSENEHHSQSGEHSGPLFKLDLQASSPQLPSLEHKDSPESGEENQSRMRNHQESTRDDSVDSEKDSKFKEPLSNLSTVEKPQIPDHQSTEKSPSIVDRSYTPDLETVSNTADLANHKQASSPSVPGYNDDFESSFESSLREDKKGSKPASPSIAENTEKSYKSPFYSSEEEIEEELSVKSGTTNGSFHHEKPVELNSQASDLREEFKEDTSHLKKVPTSMPSQTPHSQIDEMPSFSVGDRVLVSNVQPGTLRFKGQTNFANGFWAGVELDKSEGSNNGTYDDVVYFQCREGHGIFAPPDKISHLPEKFETYSDNTEDEDSFDEQSNKKAKKHSSENQALDRNLMNKKEEKSNKSEFSEKGSSDDTDKPVELQTKLTSSGKDNFLKSNLNLDLSDINYKILDNLDGDKHPVPNGGSRDIILEFEDASANDGGLQIADLDKAASKNQAPGTDKSTVDLHQGTASLSSEELIVPKVDEQDSNERKTLDAFADTLLDNFVKDAVKQFQHIKKNKDEKIMAANQIKGDFVNEDDGLGGVKVSLLRPSSSRSVDSFRTFFDDEQEEVASPELCNRPKSPVLGASGQEELAKRLAELELNQELLDFVEEPDWFDEDYGLSSRKEQQKLKRQQQQQQQEGLTGSLGLSTGEVKTPPRPELPVQAKTPEEPVMIVPHTAPEVEKLVSAATQEIWTRCNLGQGCQTLTDASKPQASKEFLGSDTEDQEACCKRSYRQAVFDLSWELIQEIFAEDPNSAQPQWVKPRRVSSSYSHRVKCPNDMSKVQEFVTSEVLKLYGLKKDQNHKMDWQKMLKFGRKKRDRVDHILVQELHEEESQWVNYDEDELYVKMQLADGIFDALLKDTVEVLSQIHEKRSKRAVC